MAPRPKKLEVQFTEAMFRIVHAAKRLDPPYHPTAFSGMVAEHGGKGAADRLLEGSTPSSGFAELLLRGKEAMKLSVEYLVLQEPWRALFSPEQLEVARSRLRKVEVDLPPDDLRSPPADTPLPQELAEEKTYPEGMTRQVTINAYERSSEARAKCLEIHGSACTVCGIDFGETYGPTAQGLIHVHHLVPISEVDDGYAVDPAKDLRPVCPNCHAVIHFGGVCRSIDEVKALLS